MGKPIPMTIGSGYLGNAFKPSGNTSANTTNPFGSVPTGPAGANKSAGNSAQRKALPMAATRHSGSPLVGNLDK